MKDGLNIMTTYKLKGRKRLGKIEETICLVFEGLMAVMIMITYKG
jgi:hypothetical protein